MLLLVTQPLGVTSAHALAALGGILHGLIATL